MEQLTKKTEVCSLKLVKLWKGWIESQRKKEKERERETKKGYVLT